MDEMLKAKVKGRPIKIPLAQYARSIKGVPENTVATYLLDMKFEGYFTFYDAPNDQLIEITNPGIAAAIGEHFLKKNREVFWRSFMNVALTVANIVVAIAAVWALAKDNNKTQQLEERLNALEQKAEEEKPTAIPNTVRLPNSGPSNTKGGGELLH